MDNLIYERAVGLLRDVATPSGFMASQSDGANYNRIWSRDGVICGLAALASDDKELIETFVKTIETLFQHQHEIGTIPSNVSVTSFSVHVSYGGLAGRVDAITWYIIGICHLSIYFEDNNKFYFKYRDSIDKALRLLEAWEFNNADLIYTPLSGNWADEYITDGYVLYDQLLRIWALKLCQKIDPKKKNEEKLNSITKRVLLNFVPNTSGEKVHPRAYEKLSDLEYLPASFSPAGYKTNFDSLAHSLFLLLGIGDESLTSSLINCAEGIRRQTFLKVIPAFWPVIKKTDAEWHLLKDNYKYDFRNYPYEFHNGGSWPMVNGFYGLALYNSLRTQDALELLSHINDLNSKDNFGFFENFNSNTGEPNGVVRCAWSAAATVLLHQAISNKYKLHF